MVYEEPPERMRELVDAKVESQFTRALRYVEAVDARAVVPSAGPPCFLDPELFGLNVITGDELIDLPRPARVPRLGWPRRAAPACCAIPGTAIDITPDDVTVDAPVPDAEVERDLRRQGARTCGATRPTGRRGWPRTGPPGAPRHADLWRTPPGVVGAAAGDGADVAGGGRRRLPAAHRRPRGRHRLPRRRGAAWAGEPYGFRFDIPRALVETVVADRAVDWANALFLSLPFPGLARRAFNEYLYNFFKSLSVERMRRAEAEAARKLDPPDDASEEIELGGYVMERWCPHRQADLTVFGEVEGDVLVCTLHGWRFDLETGECLTAEDRHLRVRRADPAD